MIEAVKRYRFRRRVRLYLGVLLVPDKERSVRRTMRDDVERWLTEGRTRGWTPQSVAAVTMAGHLIHVVRDDFTLAQRERYLDQLRTVGPKDLVAEIQWLPTIKDGAGADWDSFVFRFTFMNCMLASWLVWDKTIDLFTKSIFVTAVTWSLAGVDLEKIHLEVAGLADRIGTTPRR